MKEGYRSSSKLHIFVEACESRPVWYSITCEVIFFKAQNPQGRQLAKLARNLTCANDDDILQRKIIQGQRNW